MGRLIGPDEASREVKAIVGGIFRSKGGRPAQLWADDAATIPADVLTLAGAAIPDSTVTIDSSSMLPLVQYPPNDVDVIYGTCDGGPAWPIYARADDRLDALGGRVGTVEGVAAAAETPAGAQAKADAAQAAAATDAANKVADKQSRYVSASAGANTRGLLMKLRRGIEDARILVVGDSTGNEATEWVYLLAQYLATSFPAYTVTHRFWNETTETDYQAATTIQTGAGPRTLSVYNACRAGSSTDYFLGTRFANGIAAANPDLVLISHGHNTGTATSSDYSLNPVMYYWTHSVANDIALAFPFAPITFIAQNPSNVAGRETWQAVKASILETLAAQYGWGVIDVHQAFVDYGPWQTDLVNVDGIHPNAAGQAIWASVVQASFTDALGASPQRVRPSPLSIAAPNLLLNPAFDSWASTDPDQWTMTLCTSAKDTVNFESGTDAMKLTATGTGTSFAQGSVASASVPRLKGKWVTAAARVWVPAANTATVRMTLVDSTGGGNGKNADLGPSQRGRWQWVWASKLVDPAATSVSVRLGCRTSGTATVDATWDRVWLGEGVTPFAPA